ncbi:N-6 DNA methylase [Roseococcus microcysteis]|uniref:N-6 DNA methylase n=1 Tax=Roseococcus microcysteis TaxID=2771361 RepID=UPI00168AFC5D|nr:N-6 DNA methylase [Roseococcus microcysteis]
MDHPVVQALPATGPKREALREKGQFWTPDWVADAMVAWCAKDADHVFDPAVGAGAFFRAAKRLAARTRAPRELLGTEIDPKQIVLGCELGLAQTDYEKVVVTDFMRHRFERRFASVVANPPYVRHHRFHEDYKAELRAYGLQVTGNELDGRAGLHVFFLIKALTLLHTGGRLAFIVPADTCEGRFAPPLWAWLSKRFQIEAAVTFAPSASPFPGVDTNPIVLFIRNAPPSKNLWWGHVAAAHTSELLAWCEKGLGPWSSSELQVVPRETSEAVKTGLTRRQPADGHADTVLLGDLFRVMRGIATGDNEFFFMDRGQVNHLGLPASAFVRAIGRTRDHTGETLTQEALDALEARGRPTFLLSLGREPIESLPPSVRDYLKVGEAKGLPKRPLIAQRSPWYRMERRDPPAWLFAYLGRRNCRFIRNVAGAVPLTGFLCVYPLAKRAIDLEAATRALNDERTIANLPFVAKSYGGGALKVEPRNLERLPIPAAVLREYGLEPPAQPPLL